MEGGSSQQVPADRSGNFKPFPATAAALHEVMRARGVCPNAGRLPVKSFESY